MNSEDAKTQSRERLIIPVEIEELASVTLNAAFAVHQELGPGLLESAYRECLSHELTLRGVGYQKELSIPLCYRGRLIDAGFRADVVVERKLLVELKAVEEVIPIHKAQVITYLKILQLPLGLLINFNTVLLKNGVQRVLNLNPKRT